MTWKCSNCEADVEDSFVVCWRCGTNERGEIDPDFQHADGYEPPPVSTDQPQFNMGALFAFVAALAAVFVFLAILGGRVPAPILLLALVVSGFLAIHLASWWFVNRAKTIQHHARQRESDFDA